MDSSLLKSADQRPSFLHFIYDMDELPSHIVMRLHTQHCSHFEQELGLDPPKICYFRPKNIGELAPQIKLHEPINKSARHFYDKRINGLFKDKGEMDVWVRRNLKTSIMHEQSVTSRMKTAGKKFCCLCLAERVNIFIATQCIQKDLTKWRIRNLSSRGREVVTLGS